MKLTPAILRNLYSAIYCMKPFDRWAMPLPEEINFIVDQDPEVMGTYLYDDGGKYAHIIQISAARTAHIDTLLRTLSHEAIHMSRHNTITDAWLKHDATFRRRAHTIAKELGFDPLEL